MSEGNTSLSNSTTLSTHILVFLLFALFGLLLYGHTLQVPFYLDDFINIRDRLYAIKSFSLGEFVNASLDTEIEMEKTVLQFLPIHKLPECPDLFIN